MNALCLFHNVCIRSFPEVIFCNLIVLEITAVTGGNKAVRSEVLSESAASRKLTLFGGGLCIYILVE